MKDCVRRASGHHDHSDRIIKSSLGHDVAGLDIFPEKNFHGLTSPSAFVALLLGIGRGRGGIGKGHAQSLDGGGHGICRVHTSAGAWTRTGVLNNLLSLLLRNFVIHKLTIGLERRHDVQCLSVGGLLSSTNRSAIDHDGRTIETAHCHDATRHVLVTSRQSNEAIVPLRTHGGFNRVSDQIARLEREAHAGGPHGNAIRDADGVEAISNEIAAYHSLLHILRELQEVHVARISFVPNRTDADLRLIHVLLLQSSGVQHGLRRALGFGTR
mmetsp:Transcript_30435/g.71267  ORF Transcript_30435/g.71267 Transcript_30435/m.71267 type:complete len:270 (+) Transcript_30435:1088-1897(+)